MKFQLFSLGRVHLFLNLGFVAIALLVNGCQTASKSALSPADPANTKPEAIVQMREGDTIAITFPGSTGLDVTQPIRRDGKIVHPVLGEIAASGRTPKQLEQDILKDFGSQLVSREVRVLVTSAQFPVFVNGAVLRPGKIQSDRPLTALEAIMEAGGPDYNRANLKKVRVIRTEGSAVKNYELDIRKFIDGKAVEPFYLKPSDILFVPERFTLF